MNVCKAGDGPAVRVAGRVIEHPLKLAHDIIPEHVLDLLSIVVHMVGRNVGLVGQIELPKAMVADDRARKLKKLNAGHKKSNRDGQGFFSSCASCPSMLNERLATRIREIRVPT